MEETSEVEPEELRRTKLEEFEEQVQAIPVADKTHLLEAQKQCPELLTDDFKLTFLRTEVMNPVLAAKRYCVYWDLRMNLFGPERAFLPMTTTGALRDDVETIREGFVRVVHGHKRLLLIDPDRKKENYDLDSVVRSIWYVLTKALSDSVAMQRFGGIFVLDMASFRSFDRKLIKRITGTTNFGFPLRCAVCCIIHPPMVANALVKICKLFLRAKVRNKIHVLKTDAAFERHAGLTAAELNQAVDHDKWMAQMEFEDDEGKAETGTVSSDSS